jgi:hypothetical protein
MLSAVRSYCVGFLVLTVGSVGLRGQPQDSKAQELVKVATQTELTAAVSDHSLWHYKDVDRKPGMGETVSRVVETAHGSLSKKIEINGRALSPDELKEQDSKVEAFVHDPAQQAKQRKEGAQDDKRAEDMLKLLPTAFVWSMKSEDAKTVTLSYVPDPNFEPPTMESRVFAAMAGEIVVDKQQHRIQTIKGKLVADVKFGWGLLGKMYEGGTFDVERRELAPGIWQITESHVHILGHVLLFKNIGEQDDEVKSEFRRVPQETTLEQAAFMLRRQPESLDAKR